MIYLLAGHTPKGLNLDPGAVALDGTKEADLTMELRNLTADVLRSKGFEVWEDDDQDRLLQVLDDVISSESDVVCDIHFNAGPPTATGVEVIVPERSTETERKFAALICERFANIMNIRSRGVKSEAQTARKRIGVMRELGINLLIEVAFISNPKDIAMYHKTKAKLSVVLADILIEAEGAIK
jgi:N-acetylmuramoyl-L-alanine amidase